MKLRIVTATLGTSPFWPTAAASIAGAAPGAEHIIVCPRERMAACKPNTAPRAVLIAEGACGLYGALNQALRHAGEWEAFTWLNDDDVLRAPGFGKLLARLEAPAGVDAAYGRVDLIDGAGAGVGALPIARRGRDLRGLLARGIIPLAQPGTVIRREVFERLGGFDETYRVAADLDFFARALLAGARFEFVAAKVASFRLRVGQLSKQAAEREAETARALRPLNNWRRSIGALWRFRVANLATYANRIRRHGWVSMREIYERID